MNTVKNQREMVKEIRERGHWDVVVRPTAFPEEPLRRDELFSFVERSRVSLRGWDFPHIDLNDTPIVEVDWVGQLSDWEHHREIWRQYRSGQFVWIGGIPFEWRDRSNWWPPTKGWAANQWLGVGDVIATFTEVAEFASKLSRHLVSSPSLTVNITLRKAAGRILLVDSVNRVPLMRAYRASADDIPIERRLSEADLVGDVRRHAAEMAKELFEFFSWRPQDGLLEDLQREIFGRG